MTATFIIVLLSICSVFFILGILFFIMWKMGKKSSEKNELLVQTLERKFALVNQDPNNQSNLFDLRGEVNGAEVAVDVYFQQYSRSGQAGSGQRPWTRIRGVLSSSYPFLIHPRGQNFSENPDNSLDWYKEEVGYPPFDQKYILFKLTDAPADETLPPAVRDALIAANPPVAVLGKVVSWMKKGTGHSPELITKVVRSCADVASAIVENS